MKSDPIDPKLLMSGINKAATGQIKKVVFLCRAKNKSTCVYSTQSLIALNVEKIGEGILYHVRNTYVHGDGPITETSFQLIAQQIFIEKAEQAMAICDSVLPMLNAEPALPGTVSFEGSEITYQLLFVDNTDTLIAPYFG
jgi:hypothetical protein